MGWGGPGGLGLQSLFSDLCPCLPPSWYRKVQPRKEHLAQEAPGRAGPLPPCWLCLPGVCSAACRSLILEAWPRAGAVCYHLLQPGWEGLCYWVRGLGRHDPCAGLRGRRAPRPRPWALHRDHQRRLPSSLSKSNKPGPTCSQTGFPWIPGGKRLWALGDAPGSRGNGCTPPVSPTKCQVLQPHRGPQPSTVSSSGHWEQENMY